MRMPNVVGVAILAAFAASASAADLDADERRWVAQCVESLAAKSALVRGSAEKAIAGLGLDALPAVVAASAKLRNEADWQGLSRAVAAMGPGARKALDGLQTSWPKGTQMHFVEMLDFLETAEAGPKKDAAPKLPASPAEVKAAVEQILDGFRGRSGMSSDDPGIQLIVALGHPAVGALLEFLVSSGSARDEWSARYAATNALAAVVEPGDVPTLAAMLRQGDTWAGQALRNIDTAEAVDALVDAINRTFVDGEVLAGIGHRIRDPKIQRALFAWLKKPAAADREYVVGEVAEAFDRNGIADAVPSLMPHLGRLTELQPRQRVALALADLGEKAGIVALIDVLTAPGDSGPVRFDYPRHCAGLALNRIAGEEIYTGRQIDDGPHTLASGPPRYDADWAETARAFRAWWAKAKDKLRFDAAARAWVQ